MAGAVQFVFTLDTPGVPSTAPRDIRLADADGDIEFGDDGDLVLVAGAEGVASDLQARSQTFGPGIPPDGVPVDGEWFLDVSLGVNLVGKVLRKSPNLADAREEFRKCWAETPGVTSVLEVTSASGGPRILDIEGSVKLDSGEILVARGRAAET